MAQVDAGDGRKDKGTPTRRSAPNEAIKIAQCDFTYKDGAICGRICKGKRGLIQHKQRCLHFDEESVKDLHRCELPDTSGHVCGKTYKNEENLVAHQMKVHQRPKPMTKRLHRRRQGEYSEGDLGSQNYYSLKDAWKGPSNSSQPQVQQGTGQGFEESIAGGHHEQQPSSFPIVPSTLDSHTQMPVAAQPYLGFRGTSSEATGPVMFGSYPQHMQYQQRQDAAYPQNPMPQDYINVGSQTAFPQYRSYLPLMPDDEPPLEFQRGMCNEPSGHEAQHISPSGQLHPPHFKFPMNSQDGFGLAEESEEEGHVPYQL